ncbi:class I SAM-dependent methyltransferase [Xanthomonas euvesicatoria]|uniref:class I SAM-dependent methyltransferase n=1 Tax=Xanthomonas euvesicatoria TaxID=456327 RepID=UPI001E559E08|nr:class I SAM-dependent methyltransferase [Xanthomonas euvesicatoria]
MRGSPIFVAAAWKRSSSNFVESDGTWATGLVAPDKIYEAMMISVTINNSMFMQPRNTPESAWLGHIPFAAWLVELVRPDILVELGTHRGASYLAFCQAVQACAAPTRCYAVDTWQGDEHAGEYGDEVFLPLLDYHQRNYADFSRLMRMRFEEAVEYFDDGTVDVLHIDGLHTYEAVRNDFETWQAKLSKRAVVLFHDINVRERGFGVWKYWDEMQAQYPSFAFTHTHGLGVLLVGPEQPQPLLDLCRLDAANGDAVLGNRLFDQLGKLIGANIDIGTLAREQGRLIGLINEHQAARQILNQEIVDLKANLEQRTDALHKAALLGEQLSQTQEILASREKDNQELNASLLSMARELERMRGSLSWRLMGPFRRVRRLFG